MLINLGIWRSRLRLSNQLFSKYILPRLGRKIAPAFSALPTSMYVDRGISLSYLIAFVLLFLSFGCEYKPPLGKDRIEINSWFQNHFNDNKEYFYNFVKVFNDNPSMRDLGSTFDCSHYVSPKFPCFTDVEIKEYLKWQEKTGRYIMERRNNAVVFSGAHYFKTNEKKKQDVIIDYRYVYYPAGLKDKENLCSSNLKDFLIDSGSCQIILDDKFSLTHSWYTENYEKN